jgi:hypothetical protein
MPAQRKTSAARNKRADTTAKTHRASRCTYSEDNRRCVKDGDGNPPLCRAHQIAVAEILNRKARSPAQRVSDLVTDFLQGKRLDQDEVMGVVQDVAQQWSGMAGEYRPPIDARGRTDHQQHTRQDAPWWQPRPGQGSRQAPPVDHQQEELRVARLRARNTLGFAVGQRLTPDDVKQRKRELSKRNHPDQGGSTAKMAAINAAADVLLADPDIR